MAMDKFVVKHTGLKSKILKLTRVQDPKGRKGVNVGTDASIDRLSTSCEDGAHSMLSVAFSVKKVRNDV